MNWNKNAIGYFIYRNGVGTFDRTIADYLNLSYEEYRDILITYGAFTRNNDSQDESLYFKTQEDVENAITALEPHYILAKLMK